MLRKMRKPVDCRLNPWDFSAEAGMRVIDDRGRVYDLRESNGINKRDAGELTPVLAQAQRRGNIAVENAGVWYWTDAASVASLDRTKRRKNR